MAELYQRAELAHPGPGACRGAERDLHPVPKHTRRIREPEEATERYENLRAWRQTRRHFWVSNGPFYLYSVHPVEKIVVIRRSESFSDPADKWVRFVEPQIADVEVSGPRIVKIGTRAEFQVQISLKGKPYPEKDLEFVRYMVFDSRGELVELANPESV